MIRSELALMVDLNEGAVLPYMRQWGPNSFRACLKKGVARQCRSAARRPERAMVAPGKSSCSFAGDAFPIPSGESPDGSGQWPVLPKIKFRDTLSTCSYLVYVLRSFCTSRNSQARAKAQSRSTVLTDALNSRAACS